MADELTVSAAFEFVKGNLESIGRSITDLEIDVSGSRFIHNVQQFGTTEEAISKGELATLGWAFFKNLDVTNFAQILTATSGVAFAKMLAGEFAFFRFGSGISAPFGIADTAACYVEYVIFET